MVNDGTMAIQAEEVRQMITKEYKGQKGNVMLLDYWQEDEGRNIPPGQYTFARYDTQQMVRLICDSSGYTTSVPVSHVKFL